MQLSDVKLTDPDVFVPGVPHEMFRLLSMIFEGLLRRLERVELVASPRRIRSNFVNGVKEMRVRITPAAIGRP